jgi:CHASE3 domain sensor protein
MVEKDHQLSSLLELMIAEDVTITARSIARRSDGAFKHASDLTRRPERRTLVEAAQQRQATLRLAAAKLSKSGKMDVAARLEAAEDEIRRLKADRDILVAAVRAAILAIGRIGGMKAWREYFPVYSDAFASLRRMGAVPNADIEAFPKKEF